MYELSFSPDFFWNNSELPELTNKPSSVYESLHNMFRNDNKNFVKMVKQVLNIDLKKSNYLSDMLLHDLTMKVIEYNTCYNLNTPVKVCINKNYSVLVY